MLNLFSIMNCEAAAALARALDREDYEATRGLLRDDCVYEIRGETIDGADAIIASYQGNGEKGRRVFDEIEYESAISPLSEGTARIDYTDSVTHAGERFVHKCAQEIAFDESGTITRITHIDLEGEREALEAFKKRHGWLE